MPLVTVSSFGSRSDKSTNFCARKEEVEILKTENGKMKNGTEANPNCNLCFISYRDKADFFRPFGPQFGLKIRGGGRFPRALPLDPPLITTGLSDRMKSISVCNQYFKLLNN